MVQLKKETPLGLFSPFNSIKLHFGLWKFFWLALCTLSLCDDIRWVVFLFQMAAFNIQEALLWKEKIELAIDQVCCFQTSWF